MTATALPNKVKEAVLAYMNKEEYEHHLMDIIQSHATDIVPKRAKLLDITTTTLVFDYDPVMEGYGAGGEITIALPFAVSSMKEVQDALKQMLETASHMNDDLVYQVDQKRDAPSHRK